MRTSYIWTWTMEKKMAPTIVDNRHRIEQFADALSLSYQLKHPNQQQ